MSYFDDLNGDVIYEISKYLNLISTINLYSITDYRIPNNILNYIRNTIRYCPICLASDNYIQTEGCSSCGDYVCINCCYRCFHTSSYMGGIICAQKDCKGYICHKCVDENLDDINIFCKKCNTYRCRYHV